VNFILLYEVFFTNWINGCVAETDELLKQENQILLPLEVLRNIHYSNLQAPYIFFSFKKKLIPL
jgi:hypothetical protein